MAEKRKKNVGIITLYHKNYNFGGLLQAYALPMSIQKYFDLKAEQIEYREEKVFNSFIEKKDDKLLIGALLYRQIYKFGILFFSKANEKKLFKREQVFNKFIKEIPHSKEVYDYKTISDCLAKYNVFVCGGDQIWNDAGSQMNTKVYSLQFASGNVKKIAYAPSMAVMETSDFFKKSMREGLAQLDAISVREKRSLSILQPLTSKKIDVVVDPVLLLEKEDWNKEIVCSKIEKKYILCYLLGDNKIQRKAVKKTARNMHLNILTFPHIFLNVVRRCDLFFGDIQDYSSGPREFLGLIKNAEFVITDSFHACVFSMIFETPFVVFERNKNGEKGNMNSRIYDFLEEYHLESQLVTEEQLKEMKENPKVDFTYAHEHWKKRREESLKYLENALNDN